MTGDRELTEVEDFERDDFLEYLRTNIRGFGIFPQA